MTESAQISLKQDWHNINVIIETITRAYFSHLLHAAPPHKALFQK